MSAPSESATSPSPCACTNISLMQLFHELKQKFPGVPDHVVSNTIELYCHDKQACETHLHSEVKASLTHAYHASSSAAARQLNEPKVNLPDKCRNQPIVKSDVAKPTAVESITCQRPQTGILSTNIVTNEDEEKPKTDANQNVVEIKNKESEKQNDTSPVTVINIDNCYAKYNVESSSDLELSIDNVKDKATLQPKNNLEEPESTNYAILKSNKVKYNLHERLDKGKEKKTIKKDEPPICLQKKPTRPNTLDFKKPNPDIAFKTTNEKLKEPEDDTCRTVSPAPTQENETQPSKETSGPRSERNYPLNFQVNVNCHMTHGYDPWLEEYESPRAIASVNLTVCTPTSNMASPIRESREDDGGFEGHVTVTVSPSTTRPPGRPAPPPPPRAPPSRLESPRPTRAAPEPPGSNNERSLIERQKERLKRLAMALAQEKGRLAQLNRETQILAAPPPPAVAKQKLKDYVERLREQCDSMAKRLERGSNAPDQADNFYSNIYTGQQLPSSWQCHMCTFRNHPLLDKCEECDMPRILVGTSLSRTNDSGFGSFRDQNRRIGQDTTEITEIVDGIREIPKLTI